MKLNFFKCEEVLIEDFAQDEVYECFYVMSDDCVTVTDDAGETLLTLNDDDMEFTGSTELTVPEGYYAHGIGWRFTEFDIQLNDPNHKLTAADFTWSYLYFGDLEFPVLALREEVGTLEFEMSSDGRYDEEYTERECDS